MTDCPGWFVHTGRAEPHDDWVDPSAQVVAHLRSRGLEPLSAYTGVVAELGPLWPAALARDVRDLGELSESAVDEDLAWFVRSPWPEVGLREVIRLLWHWTDQLQPDWELRARDLLSWPYARIVSFQTAHPPSP